MMISCCIVVDVYNYIYVSSYSQVGSDEEGDFSLDIYPVMLDDDAKYQCQVGPSPTGTVVNRKTKKKCQHVTDGFSFNSPRHTGHSIAICHLNRSCST